MANPPTIDRRSPKNQNLRNFIEWVEKTQFYGKFTVTCQKGEAIGTIEMNATHRVDDFSERRTGNEP